MPLSVKGAGRACGFAAALGLVLGVAAAGRAGPPGTLTLDHLKRMSDAELADLFARADVGRPPVGDARGKVLRLNDAALPRVRAGMQNVLWKGKTLGDDGAFVNRWAFGVRAVGERYTIGPSHLDGRPAVIIEYPPGTPVLANTRDELREVAPGLYMGPLYDCRGCPRVKGYVAIQLDPGCR